MDPRSQHVTKVASLSDGRRLTHPTPALGLSALDPSYTAAPGVGGEGAARVMHTSHGA
jgi:hypothetical protein